MPSGPGNLRCGKPRMTDRSSSEETGETKETKVEEERVGKERGARKEEIADEEVEEAAKTEEKYESK